MTLFVAAVTLKPLTLLDLGGGTKCPNPFHIVIAGFLGAKAPLGLAHVTVTVTVTVSQ